MSNSLLKNRILLFIPFFTLVVTTNFVKFTALITVTTLVSLSEVSWGFFRDEKVYSKEFSGCCVISETGKGVYCSAPPTEAVCLFISNPTKVT